MKIRGADLHVARLRGLFSPKAKQAINRGLYAAGQLIEIEAEQSITAGSASGKSHIPSKPGEPPNADTRQLDTNIQTIFAGDLKVEVEATAPYAVALEGGTSKMAARAFMKPAADKEGGKAQELVAKALSSALRN